MLLLPYLKGNTTRPRVNRRAEHIQGRAGSDSSSPQTRSIRLRVLLAQRRRRMVLPDGVGSYSKNFGKELPGKHTRNGECSDR
ncbi:Uncharacterized protein HZ326_22868 [Fusarium oxysporum f. sp. albedinis]|nr:Uncharacterized protein HZ326_22868 [Fusarium oxysporum f. sp. albedinis]